MDSGGGGVGQPLEEFQGLLLVSRVHEGADFVEEEEVVREPLLAFGGGVFLQTMASGGGQEAPAAVGLLQRPLQQRHAGVGGLLDGQCQVWDLGEVPEGLAIPVKEEHAGVGGILDQHQRQQELL